MRTGICAFFALALAACSKGADDGVTPPACTVTSVAISGAPAELLVGGTAALTAEISPSTCTGTVTWSTSNAAVLSVTGGAITAVSAGGPVTITASIGGKSGLANITVRAVPVARVAITLDSLVVLRGTSTQLVAQALDGGGNPLSGRAIAWTLAPGGSATVSATGLVTTSALGSLDAVIAASEGKADTARIWSARSRLAYFWNQSASVAGSYPAHATYTFNTGGGANAINRTAIGTYQVNYPGIAGIDPETEALFVSRYGGSDGSFCQIDSWGASSAGVSCYDFGGAINDGQFTLAVLGSATLTGRFAYAWADAPTSPTAYGPSEYYRYSSSHRPMSILRTSAGVYSVTFPGLGRANATDLEGVMISAYQSPLPCQSGGTTSTGADLTVVVRCFGATGTPTDNYFTIAVVTQPRAGAKLAFVDSESGGAVRPTGSTAITRTAPGTYNVVFTGLNRSATGTESFFVTPVGPDPRRCQVEGWSFGALSTDVTVYCSTPAGVRIDSRFMLVGLQ